MTAIQHILKILFLDFDGVLNSERTFQALGGYPDDFRPAERAKFDPVAIALIAKLCRETGAKIVVSSAWRNLHSVEECAQELGLPIIDQTPYLGADVYASGVQRGDEIQAWLDQHPEVTHYAIVDDMLDMLESQLHRFVQTDPDNGLSHKDYMNLRNLLERAPEETAIA